MHWAEVVMFCECKIIQFFSVVFCIVRVVLKLDCRLVINETHEQMATSGKKVMQ
jgi:hypothetical protein